MNYKPLFILIAAALFLPAVNAGAQDVTLEYIFQDTNLVNPRPSLKYILPKSSRIYYYADDDFDGMLDLFDHNYATGETYKYPDTANSPSEFIVLQNGDLISIIDGDIFISKDFAGTRQFTKDVQLTETGSYEYSPFLSGNTLLYRRAGNYFLTVIDTVPGKKTELQLTYDESDSISYQILAVSGGYSGKGQVITRILFAKYDNSPKRELIFPNYTNEFVTIDRQKRGISKVELLEYEVLSLKRPKEKTIRLLTPADSLGFRVNTLKFPDSVRYSTQYAAYSPDGTLLMLDAETLDRHNRKLFRYEVLLKKISEVYSESDTAWFERHDNPTRFTGPDEVVFESEISGYNSVYRINTDGSGRSMIAGGNYTITASLADPANKKLYFIANIGSPDEYNVFETDFNRTYIKKLTYKSGDYLDMTLSSDGGQLFFSHSSMTEPDEIYRYDVPSGTVSRITSTISPAFSGVDWAIPDIITFPNSEDGVTVHALLYKPKDFSKKKKYPLLCFAHGAGYLQNVTKGFSPYRDNFMVNTFLVSQGYIILDVDFRGSSGYGKEFRNKTYRNLGYWEVSDFISGIEHLNGLGMIDKDRVGIYGGSYGGFITLMALFNHPEYFKCGVSMRPVSDWRNYFYGNRWFTLARLGDYGIEENRKYYELSSPLTYAENLQSPLLITHGMLDDNVFFQQSVLLTQRLIELGKDFEVMFYPKENHGFHIQSSWLDQYKRIFRFFERYLKK